MHFEESRWCWVVYEKNLVLRQRALHLKGRRRRKKPESDEEEEEEHAGGPGEKEEEIKSPCKYLVQEGAGGGEGSLIHWFLRKRLSLSLLLSRGGGRDSYSSRGEFINNILCNWSALELLYIQGNEIFEGSALKRKKLRDLLLIECLCVCVAVSSGRRKHCKAHLLVEFFGWLSFCALK